MLTICFTYCYSPVQSAEDGCYEPLAPNQSPINPPYKTACELKKGSHISQPGTTAIMNSDPKLLELEYAWTLKLIVVELFVFWIFVKKDCLCLWLSFIAPMICLNIILVCTQTIL